MDGILRENGIEIKVVRREQKRDERVAKQSNEMGILGGPQTPRQCNITRSSKAG